MAGVPIERAHRLGPEKQDKPWPIITKFLHFKDREKVLNFPIIGVSQTWLMSNLACLLFFFFFTSLI